MANIGSSEALNPIWECLNASGRSGDPQHDVLGLLDVHGIEIWQESSRSVPPEVSQQELTQDSVKSWIEGHSRINPPPQHFAGLRLLLGVRVAPPDCIRPPENALATRFSAKALSQSFDIPPMAIERAAQGRAWFLDLPCRRFGERQTVLSRSLGTDTFSITWSFNTNTRITHGFLVLGFRSTEVREHILHNLGKVRGFISSSEFLPFIMINAALGLYREIFSHHYLQGSVADRRIGTYFSGVRAGEVFEETNDRAKAVVGMQSNLRAVKAAIHFSLAFHESRLLSMSDQDWNYVQANSLEIEAGLKCFRHEIQAMLDEGEEYQQQTTRQLSTVLGMMAQQQQELTIELSQISTRMAEENRQDQRIGIQIAKSSKTIAVESKRDSTSMKTLSVVAMIFLPGTSVSSFLSMQMFQWRISKGEFVSAQLWIYFVITIPLTILTVAAWWLWMRWNTKRESKEIKEVIGDDIELVVKSA